MKTKHTTQSTIRSLRILMGLFSAAALSFLALFAAANPSTHGETTRPAGVTRRTFMKVMPQGVIQSTDTGNSKGTSPATKVAHRRVLGPLGNTVWQYDDDTAIAGGVSIDAN